MHNWFTITEWLPSNKRLACYIYKMMIEGIVAVGLSDTLTYPANLAA